MTSKVRSRDRWLHPPGYAPFKAANEIVVPDELAAQIMPPRLVVRGPLEHLFHVAVVDRDQVRALAQQLAGRDWAEAVPVLRPWLNVVQQLPQLPGGAALGHEVLSLIVRQGHVQGDLGEQAADRTAPVIKAGSKQCFQPCRS